MDEGVDGVAGDDLTVLFVDDYRAYVRAGEEYLESVDDGIRVLPETCAESALERLGDAAVDCVVCDYEMPEMTGAEFVESAREAHPGLPIIVLTGHDPERLSSPVAEGETTVLQKGSGTRTFEELRRAIRDVSRVETGFRFDNVTG